MDIEKPSNYDEELQKLEDIIKYNEENHGDTEVRDAIMGKADFFLKSGEDEKAIKTYIYAYEKTVGVSKRLEIYMILLQIYFRQNKLDEIKMYITKSKALLEEGGDWENKNKLKVAYFDRGLRGTVFLDYARLRQVRQALRGRNEHLQQP